MNLIYAVLSTLALAHGPGTDSLAAGRRIAASVQLAAQEYRNGFSAGKLTSPAEVNEARLFLADARRTAQMLPARIATGTITDIDRLHGDGRPNGATRFRRRERSTCHRPSGGRLGSAARRNP